MRLIVSLVLAALGFPLIARANGRPPAVVSLAADPRDPNRMLLGASFGGLLSNDCGATWRWVCEQSIGYSGVWDPEFLFSAESNAIFATSFNGLRVSRDDGCSWSVLPGLSDAFADDLERSYETIGGVRRQILWVATSSAARRNCLYESHDDGATFAETGLCSDTLFFKHVRVAPGDPGRVYVLGYDARTGMMRTTFHRSTGRGASGVLAFETVALPDRLQGLQDARFLTSRDRLYVRGKGAAGAALEVSEDGGDSWRAVTPAGVMQISDGLLVGDAIYLATNRGILRSVDQGGTWSTVWTGPGASCLFADETWARDAMSPAALLACASPFVEPRAPVIATADGLTWAPFFRFEQLQGPIHCAGTSPTAMICEPLYEGLLTQLVPPEVGPMSGPGCRSIGSSAPDASAPPDAGVPGADAGPGVGASPSSGKAGCSLVGESRDGAAQFLILLVAGTSLVASRRCRRRATGRG